MNKDELIKLALNEEDAKKAEVIMKMAISENEKEVKLAEIEARKEIAKQESADKQSEIEVRKDELEVRHEEIAMRADIGEQEHEAKMAEVEARKEDTQAKVSISNTEAQTKQAEIEAENCRSKRERILGWIKVGATILVNALIVAFGFWKTKKTFLFEETGTIRNQASKTQLEKPMEIR